MEIEALGSSTIKIALTAEDLEAAEIDYDDIDKDIPETRRFMQSLITAAENKTGLSLSEERLYVEAFGDKEGGCLIYISARHALRRQSRAAERQTVCEIGEKAALKPLISELSRRYEGSSTEIYSDGSTYRLIITAMPDEWLLRLLCEFGEVIPHPAAAEATRERFSPLSVKDI